MNKHTRKDEMMRPEVTKGPLRASSKVYTSPQGHDDIRVPMREIALTNGEAFRVYDTSGPYSDESATIDVEQGLQPVRAKWIAERSGVEEYDGREIKPEDNGNVSGKHLARDFPGKRKPLRGQDGHPVTQFEFARKGIVTKEMIAIAHRENLGRQQAYEDAKANLEDG